jgi:HrpA-like RNA helicase
MEFLFNYTGKSSRIPIFLLRAPPPYPHKKAKIFVSQPRRIAVCSLVNRIRDVEPEFRDVVALRMGHGERMYETDKTRAWFVTTGYLVRYLSTNMDRFKSVTHLIIDEVHERSVDTDILCLLCKRLLASNDNIRLVLMSATMAAAMYQTYFGTPEPPIKVGVKLYPVREVYLEGIIKATSLPMRFDNVVNSLIGDCNNLRGKKTPNPHYMERLVTLAAQLAVQVGNNGSSVLIFVPGMGEILAITENIEKMHIPGSKVTCYSVHSDIPLEEQLAVFDALGKDERRIIIATNAAESSVTLPEVDNVICLGLCKQIIYNEASHRQMLSAAWISKANAMQRAGRTGRIRAGTVYRLYTKCVYTDCFDAFEAGEMLRIPLDSVILSLKDMLPDENITDVLRNCLEPPQLHTIGRSFASLHKWHFISSAEEDSHITKIGSFALALGTDIMLGCLVGLGIQMGVGPEVIQLAAVLTFPKPAWIMGSSLIHSPSQLNDIVVTTFSSRSHFDANLFSDPLATMNLLWDYSSKNHQPHDWYKKYGISMPRIKQLAKVYFSLLERVASFMHVPSSALQLECSPQNMPYSKITILRVIMAWVFHESVIQCDTKRFTKNVVDGSVHFPIHKKSDQVDESLLTQVFKSRHPFEFVDYTETSYEGHFQIEAESIQEGISRDLENRFLSFCFHHKFDAGWIVKDSEMILFVVENGSLSEAIHEKLHPVSSSEGVYTAVEKSSKNKRGINERACGFWEFKKVNGNDASEATQPIRLYRIDRSKKKDIQSLHSLAANEVYSRAMDACSCSFEGYNKKKEMKFRLKTRGKQRFVPDRDLTDLFGSTKVDCKRKDDPGRCKKAISFPASESGPLFSKQKIGSWLTPIIDAIPEGARLLSVLASSYRSPVLKLMPAGANAEEEVNPDEDPLEMFFGTDEAFLNKRWTRYPSGESVLVAITSFPASILPLEDKDTTLFCVPANALELRRGGIKVENLTLLPPGKLFFLLCQVTFGLCRSKTWKELSTGLKASLKLSKKAKGDSTSLEVFWKEKISLAMAFDQAASHLGEELQCYPEIVSKFLQVFNGVDKYELAPWATLPSNPFIDKNLELLRKDVSKPYGRKHLPNVSEANDSDIESIQSALPDLIEPNLSNNVKEIAKGPAPPVPRSNGSTSKLKDRASSIHDAFEYCWKMTLNQFLVINALTEIPSVNSAVNQPSSNLQMNEQAMNATNVLLNLLRDIADIVGVESIESDTCPTWSLYSIVDETKNTYYYAQFDEGNLSFSPLSNCHTEALPTWMRQKEHRPGTINDVLACMPPSLLSESDLYTTKVKDHTVVCFPTVEWAIRMEAAYWLERQYCSKKKHWYEQSLQALTIDVKNNNEPQSEQKSGSAPHKNKKKRAKKPGKKKHLENGQT